MVDGNRRRVGQVLAGVLAIATLVTVVAAMLAEPEPAPQPERTPAVADESPRPTILHVVEGQEDNLSPLPAQHESPASLPLVVEDPAASSAALLSPFPAAELR